MRKECLDTVFELAQTDSRVNFIGSDLGFGTLKAFQKQFPQRFFMEGVSEAALVGMAAGMAMEGKIVYFNTIATFISRRAYEQVCLDACLHNVPVRFLGNGGGLVYAPLGPTHLAIEDLSIMRTIPNLTILCPADPFEMIQLMRLTLTPPGPIYVRIARGGENQITEEIQRRLEFKPSIGKGYLASPGEKVAIVTTGVTLHEALKAAKNLESLSIKPKILHFPTVKPFDSPFLLEQLKGIDAVFTVEENSILGGLGGIVSEFLLESGLRPKLFKRIGIPDEFPSKYGNQASLMKHYGLDGNSIAETISSLMKGIL